LPKLTAKFDKNDFHKAWNFIIPEHKEREYSPIQSIPLLTKQNRSTKHRKIKQKN
jgi:hypothetical protein